jgi:hypothetical protein
MGIHALSAVGKVVKVSLIDLTPSPENDALYQPININDPAFREMVQTIKERGILVPLVATADGYIVSGHRRYAAATVAGLASVPCQYLSMRRDDDPDEFVRLLAVYNKQRIKTFAERVREEIVGVECADAYAHLKEYREQKSGLGRISESTKIETLPERHRARISTSKMPMLREALDAANDRRDQWPMSVRQYHYILVASGRKFLKHAKKPESVYQNDEKSYKDLCNLLARARIAGQFPWEAIADETRPFQPWNTWREPGAFIRAKVDGFLKSYWRDLLQSQPNHIEIIAEKLTVKATIEPVAADYTIPTQIGRGFSCVIMRREIAERFKASSREKLVAILVGDLDPDGEGICENFARSMRDDFSIPQKQIIAIKAALCLDHTTRFNLPPSMKAKKTSSRFKRFFERFGADAWEIEALPADVLAAELRNIIDSVIDRQAFEHERHQESLDAQHIEAARRAAMSSLKEMQFGEGGEA